MMPGNTVEVNYDKDAGKIVTRIIAEVDTPQHVEN